MILLSSAFLAHNNNSVKVYHNKNKAYTEKKQSIRLKYPLVKIKKHPKTIGTNPTRHSQIRQQIIEFFL